MSKPPIAFWTEYAICIALLVIGMLLVPLNLTGINLEFIPGDLGDARFNSYILEHGYQWIKGTVSSFWDAPFMYPERNVIAMSDNLLGTLPLYAFIRELGNDRETAFQYWIIGIFLLNFISTYWVIYKLSDNRIIAACSAYIFAFSIFIFGQSNHAQMFPRFMIPFIIYWCYQYMSSLKIKYFLMLLTGTVFQIYCGIYMGLLSALGTMIFLISYFAIYRNTQFINQFKSPATVIKHFASAAVAFLLLSPLLFPYLSEIERSGYRDWNEVLESLPEIRSYFYSTEASKTWQFLSKHGEHRFTHWWNHQIFSGLIPTLSFISGIIFLFSKKTADKMIKTFALSSLVIFIFTLNVSGYSLYWLIYNLPGFGALRSLDRVININVYFFAILFGLLVLALAKQKPNLKPLIWILPILIVADNIVNTDKIIRFEKWYAKERVEYVKDVIRSQAGSYIGPIVYLPSAVPEKHFEVQLDVMLACQDLGIPSVNGYSGSTPKGYNEFDKFISEEALKIWLREKKLSENDIVIIREQEF